MILLDAETRYSMIEKLVLALVNAKNNLRQFFESHPIIVYMDHPTMQILAKPDFSGRLRKWVIELGVYDITYFQWTVKKGHVLADFFVEIQSFDSIMNIRPKWKEN